MIITQNTVRNTQNAVKLLSLFTSAVSKFREFVNKFLLLFNFKAFLHLISWKMAYSLNAKMIRNYIKVKIYLLSYILNLYIL